MSAPFSLPKTNKNRNKEQKKGSEKWWLSNTTKMFIYRLFIATYNPKFPPVLLTEPVHDIPWSTSTHSIVQCKIYAVMINTQVKEGQRSNTAINSPMKKPFLFYFSTVFLWNVFS